MHRYARDAGTTPPKKSAARPRRKCPGSCRLRQMRNKQEESSVIMCVCRPEEVADASILQGMLGGTTPPKKSAARPRRGKMSWFPVDSGKCGINKKRVL
ncbi:hypothetical protein TNCV_1215921 [Trichonephila clavipes]|nr:hypothetical protein TNCV_1215921 [Trichonephila clavipes]